MKIAWGAIAPLNAVGLVATPGEIDGYPRISNIAVDTAPAKLTADRLAVASALGFHRYQSGQLTLDQPISALTAKTIEQFFAPRWTHVVPVHPSNLPIPRGHAVMFLSPEGGDHQVPEGIDFTLEVTRRDRTRGIQDKGNLIAIASNAWMHAEGDANSLEYYFPFLAVAVIFSEDLAVDRIVLPKGVIAEEQALYKVRALLACAGLGLQIDD